MYEPIIRELEEDDLTKGFLTTLDSLRKTSNLSNNKAVEIYKKIRTNPEHHIIVAEIGGIIVGTATLLIEPKFIHDGGLVGHIEDVAIDKKFQGQKIGEKVIKYSLEFAKNQGCYKTILDCTDNVKKFYEKIGFKNIANGLRFDHN